MKLTAYLYIAVLVLPAIACNPEPEKAGTPVENQAASADTSEKHFLITAAGDTLPTGVPIPFTGKQIDPFSVAKPKTLPIQSPPTLTPIHKNIRKAGTPRTVKIPKKLEVITLGKNGISLPEVVPARGKVVVAVQPLPVSAEKLDLEVKGNTNFQSLSVKQGLNHSVVRSILKDSRGDIWFGGDNGVSRYDGSYLTHYTTEEGLSGNSLPYTFTSYRDLILYKLVFQFEHECSPLS